jgi:nucleoside-diphosphate-sugar epimerase
MRTFRVLVPGAERTVGALVGGLVAPTAHPVRELVRPLCTTGCEDHPATSERIEAGVSHAGPDGTVRPVPAQDSDLVVAITGPTGTFGFGLVPLLQADARIAHVVGIARRPFDPTDHGWTKMAYRRGDVRDHASLEQAFQGADVVVHLAFLITGTASRATIRAVNVEGTVNTVRAAAAAGAKRFVFASSVAAYGFHADNPIGMTEDWPVRPAAHLFYAQEKAQLEGLLGGEVARHPGLDLYMLRPSIVLGTHAVGGKDLRLGPLAPLVSRLARRAGALRFPLPAPVPRLPVQLVHEDDVGQALALCVAGAGPPGAYNIAGDGVLSVTEVVRELGLTPVPVPGGLVRGPARAVAALGALPLVPPTTAWAEVLSHPAIMDTTKAKRELGWTPRYTGLDALRQTLRRGRDRPG